MKDLFPRIVKAGRRRCPERAQNWREAAPPKALRRYVKRADKAATLAQVTREWWQYEQALYEEYKDALYEDMDAAWDYEAWAQGLMDEEEASARARAHYDCEPLYDYEIDEDWRDFDPRYERDPHLMSLDNGFY